MLLAQPHPECPIVNAGRYLLARIGPMDAEGLAECYCSLAVLVLEHRFVRALIVGEGAGDPLAHLAARDAVIALHVLGIPAGFRLAFVAFTPQALNAYRHAEIEAAARGMRVKLFEEEAQAVRWLTDPELH